jgi:transcriptional regulator with PAS, ATPase and Fis domain
VRHLVDDATMTLIGERIATCMARVDTPGNLRLLEQLLKVVVNTSAVPGGQLIVARHLFSLLFEAVDTKKIGAVRQQLAWKALQNLRKHPVRGSR